MPKNKNHKRKKVKRVNKSKDPNEHQILCKSCRAYFSEKRYENHLSDDNCGKLGEGGNQKKGKKAMGLEKKIRLGAKKHNKNN